MAEAQAVNRHLQKHGHVKLVKASWLLDCLAAKTLVLLGAQHALTPAMLTSAVPVSRMGPASTSPKVSEACFSCGLLLSGQI